MPKFMKTLNNISRAQAVFRAGKEIAPDVAPHHHALLLCVCRRPGAMQEELSRELCLNKSTVARAVSILEERGYLQRQSDPQDKRRLYVYPTARAEQIIPQIRAASSEWYEKITDGITEEELATFASILAKIEANAKRQLEI